MSLILIGCSTAFCLDPNKSIRQYGLDVWGPDKGFPYFAIHSIIQTRDGYLWLATDDGAVRFDGTQFTLFDSSDAKGIRHNNISSFVEDAEGNLWLGTRGGGVTKYHDGVFTNYSLSEGLPGLMIHAMCKDHEGNIWLAIEQFGLSKLRDGKFTNLPFTFQKKVGQFYVVTEFKDGSLVFGAGGFVRTTPDKKSFILRPKRSGYVKGIIEDENGRRWVGTDIGLYFFQNDTLLLVDIPGAPSYKAITALYEDHDNNIWIGTEGDGLYRYTNDKFSVLTMNDGLPSNRILSFAEDRENNLWVGTRGGGLVRLKNQNITTLTQLDGLSGDYISAVYECNDGTMYIGVKDKGLDELKNGVIVRNYKFGDTAHINHVRAIFEVSPGKLWVGTQRGIFIIDRNSNSPPTPIARSRETDSIIVPGVRVIFKDSKNTLWIGSYGRGLWKQQNSKFSYFDLPDSQQMKGGYNRVIVESPDGSYWFGTQAGVYHVTDSTTIRYCTQNGLSGDQVFALLLDDDGALWVGYYGTGLSRIKNGRITNYAKKHGLFDDVIYSILDDGRGNLWMSSNKGIFSISKVQLNNFADGTISSLQCVTYGINDGMKSVECNGGSQYSGFKMRDGKLMFATVKGVVIIDPANLQTNSLPPPVAIEDVVVDGKLHQAYHPITTHAGVKDFEIQYTALSYVVPEKVRFRYTLEGYDEQWIEAGARRKAYYTNLPHGTYLFKVIACNNAGVWNYQPATLQIIIPPQFWETWWFRISMTLIGFLIVLRVVKKREQIIKERANEKLAMQRLLADLESRALRAQMNPHFIFNALNSIQECILTNKTETACEYLSKFAQLLRITLESSEKTYIPLDKEIRVLQLYLELESLRFENEFEYTVTVDPDLEDMMIQIPAMMIQPYVENSIWHGLLHKQGDRKLQISLKHSDTLILCIIEDNGIGRERAATIKHALKKDYESKGMKVTRERLEMMRKGSGKNASVRIIDLVDEQQQPSGTRVELFIPIQNI